MKTLKAQQAYNREVPWDILTIAMKFFHDRTERERSVVYDQHEAIEGKLFSVKYGCLTFEMTSNDLDISIFGMSVKLAFF